MQEKLALTVGVFGFYSSMNFGDDLMALIVCKYLETLNVKPVLFTDNKKLYDKYSINTESSISTFISRIDMLVYGGGGVLLSENSVLLSQINQLIEACHANCIPFYVISIGGNGLALDKLSSIQQRLVKSAKYITLRNPQDLVVLNDISTPGDFYHDIVWLTPYFFEFKSPKSIVKRIGINMSFGSERYSKLFTLIMKFIVRLRKDCEFIFLDGTPKTESRFLKVLDLSTYSNNCSKATYSELYEYVALIGSLDLVITNRLHIGVVALSYGITTISFLGETKAKLLFENVGIKDLVWEKDGFYKILYYFSTSKQLKKITTILKNFDTSPITNNSMNHLKKLSAIIQKNSKLSE